MSTQKTTDELVKELFDTVQEKKLAIQNVEKPNWSTSCEFSYTPNTSRDRTDIRLIEDVRKIIDMHAFLLDRKEKSEKAAQELGVDFSFKWLGYTIDEWKSDFQIRVNMLTIKQKRKELAELEARLNVILSPELRAKMEIEAITKILEK